MNYYPNQVTRPAFENVTLTAAFSGNRKSFETEGMEKLSLDIKYLQGATESANKIELQLEHSPDKGTTWYSLVIDATGATSVLTPRVWEVTGDNNVNIIVDIAYKMMRLSIRESGVVTNFGTATVTYTVSGL